MKLMRGKNKFVRKRLAKKFYVNTRKGIRYLMPYEVRRGI